jgi:apolipoprotein N-acyltransferase
MIVAAHAAASWAVERTAWLAGRLAGLDGWRRWAASFVLGALSILAMAPVFAWPVLFLTLPGLVWLLDGTSGIESSKRRYRAAAAVGWWFGFGYHAAGLYWIGEAFLVEAEVFAWLLPFAVTIMPAGLALFSAAATAAAVALWRPGGGRVVALAVTLSAAEWLRGHVLTGFPWNVLGYALTQPLPLMQSAALVGIYGLTLLVVLVAALPLVALADDGWTRRGGRGAALSAALLAALAAYGAFRLSAPLPATVDGVRVRLVQPSIPQREKWRPERQRDIFVRHLDLTLTAPDGRVDGLAGITHVVWPEAAMPFQPLRSPEAVAAIGQRLGEGRWLVSGALRSETNAEGARRAYNSLMIFGATGLVGLYDKIHLVPFGEYLPFQSALEFIGLQQLTRVRGGFSTGIKPRPLVEVPGLPAAAPLICYEAIFPAAVVQGAARPGVLINVTNDGWFGRTSGPHQHFHQARVRAVEEGLPLLRAANNGISAIVDPYGRILAKIALDEIGTIDGDLPFPLTLPPYARIGDLPFALAWAALLLTLIIVRPIKSRTYTA